MDLCESLKSFKFVVFVVLTSFCVFDYFFLYFS